jgi:hypothetical protein
MAKTIQFGEHGNPQHPHCMACEELQADALDGVLSPGDQAFFDQHLAGCTSCMESYSQAHRGAAWLSMLKSPRPEPSELLMERILAQTSGAASLGNADTIFEAAPYIPAGVNPLPANVLPFVSRPAAASRFTRMTRLAMEPRYAMTAAMAFFSIALTLNLMGVRLDQLHTADLKPSSLKRSYYEANASAVRYYDNLRVVRVVEARVDDYRQANEDSAPTEKQAAPASAPDQQPSEPRQEQKKQEKPQGSSRRESPLPQNRMLNVGYSGVPERLRRDASSAAFVTVNGRREGGLA